MAFTRLPDEMELNSLVVGKPISMGTRIITGMESEVDFCASNGSVFRLQPESEVVFEDDRTRDSKEVGPVDLDLFRGSILIKVSELEGVGHVQIKSDRIVGSIRGGGEVEFVWPWKFSVHRGLMVVTLVTTDSHSFTGLVSEGDVLDMGSQVDWSSRLKISPESTLDLDLAFKELGRGGGSSE